MNRTPAGVESLFDPEELRRVFGHFPTGVVVVSGRDDDGPCALVTGSFTAVSLDPPLVTFTPNRDCETFARLSSAGTFCINVLGLDGESICRDIATSTADPLEGIAWHDGGNGHPVLDNATAWFECSLETVFEAGERSIALAKVNAFGTLRPHSPLIFLQGGMGRFASSSMALAPDVQDDASILSAEVARPEIERLARELNAEASIMVPIDGALMVVAIANHTGPTDGQMLGALVPLIAPLGEGFVAFTGEDAIAKWLEGGGPFDEATKTHHLNRLAQIRERGWTMSLSGPQNERILYDDFRRSAAGQLTPDEEESLRLKVSRLARFYQYIDSLGDERLEVHSIIAPVLDDNQRPVMVLRLSQVGSIDQLTARWFGERLVAGAHTVSAALKRRGLATEKSLEIGSTHD